MDIIKTNKNVIMTEEDEINYKAADHCHICEKIIFNNDKVLDHDHITGKYRGAAHNECNINFIIKIIKY